MRKVSALLAALFLCLAASGQTKIVRDFRPVLDSMNVLIQERTSVLPTLRLRSISRSGDRLDFRFTESLSDVPWKKADVAWFRRKLESLFPAEYKNCTVGEVYAKYLTLDKIAMPGLHNDGRPHETPFRVTDRKGPVLVREDGAQTFAKGLSGRHIALWQSHGRYYEEKTSRWEWQRAPTFLTVEDMYTQSYVLPFLIPMLERAGAYVLTPRERDTQVREIVADNDPAFAGPREGLLRQKGSYAESGRWTDAGEGFADPKPFYTGMENPFRMGTARQARCDRDGEEEVRWTADFAQRGTYAVYISYKTLANSSSAAHYTVHHLGGATRFTVNQKMGGGTWIYLGTFEFEGEGGVSLTNRGEPGTVVTADAVRFGGGMGKIARGQSDEPVETWTTSGVPAYMEGALYAMQWAGVDSTILTAHPDDYTNDFADRGPWVGMMAGGSRVNPKEEGKGIPFDLSLAFHSDAGVTPDDSIVGTLAIYTLLADNKQELPDGEDRLSCRQYADFVQTQVVQDLRAGFEPEWTRRHLWDRSYSESRTPAVPAMILELLAHQNFADMKYGLDPSFRFTVCRAVYKGMLKFLADRYGFHYAVQPLPVRAFSATFGDGFTARLRWKPTDDPLEKTAEPEGYILYTRIDGGAFDRGVILKDTSLEDGFVTTEVSLSPDHLYSFKIEAYNEGGRSFPSEILSVGMPSVTQKNRTVLVVNNFTRVSGPTWFDTPTYAGFDLKLDGGVPLGKDISYIGEQYQFRRDLAWIDDDNPGFGGTFTNEAGRQAAGNTFDYPAVHGKALMDAGYRFCSMGADAFAELPADGIWAVDLICGKQVSVPSGRPGAAADRFQVFPEPLQQALRRFTAGGGHVFASGAHIGTDLWDHVYPGTDPSWQPAAQTFAQEVLGYRWLTNYASRTAQVWSMKSPRMDVSGLPEMAFRHVPNEAVYHVETPDGIVPADDKGSTILRYRDTNISAGICYEGKGYRTVVLGFPLETLSDPNHIKETLAAALAFFLRQP